MPTLLTPPTLEVVLQGLHESEIRCGIRNEPPAGGITAWIDYGSRTEKATFYGTIVGDRQVWPAADRIAAWMHETALRLFPDSPYAPGNRGIWVKSKCLNREEFVLVGWTDPEGSRRHIGALLLG
jgi:hypothetical protein